MTQNDNLVMTWEDMTVPLPLASLPNEPGFAFIGVTRDGKEVDCVVEKSSAGYCFIGGNTPYEQLKGWRRNPPPATVTECLRLRKFNGAMQDIRSMKLSVEEVAVLRKLVELKAWEAGKCHG